MKCKYHSDKDATWHCESCDTAFCMGCVEVEKNAVVPKCILCREYLSSYGVSSQVEPFWNKLGDIWKYPLNKNSQSFFIFFAVVAFILGFIIDFVPVMMVKAILRFVLLSFAVSYVFKVLTKTGQGNFEAPTYSEAVVDNTDKMTSSVIGLFVLVFLTGILAHKISPEYGLAIFELVLVFLLPAILMTLAMSKQLTFALNPVEMIRTIAGIGFPYLIIAGITMVIFYSMAWAESFVNEWLPDALTFCLSTTVSVFFYTILFHLLGYVVYQYHAELGYRVNLETIAANIDNISDEQRMMNHADIYIQETRFEDAKDMLQRASNEPKLQEAALSKLIKLNIAKKDKAGMILAANNYFLNPNIEKYGEKAYQVYLAVSRVEPRFKPMNAVARAILIGQIRSKMGMEHFEKLTADLDGKIASDHDFPKVLFAQAKFFSDILMQDDQAVPMLNHIVEKYPHFQKISEVRQLLKVLGN